MQVSAIPAAAPRPDTVGYRSRWTPRYRLVAAAGLGVAAGAALGFGTPRPAFDPDLARVLGFMAALKLGFAAAALFISWWRLARPASRWRMVAYVAGPPMAAGGAILMLALNHLGMAAITLHAGLLAVLAASLTDEAFFARRSA